MKTETKKTKIVCTLGPASTELALIKKMIQAGMNAARLNFSHGNYSHFKELINNIRKASKELNEPIAIIQDLQGPKIRVGNLPEEGVKVHKGKEVTLTTESKFTEGKIPVQYKKLPKDVKKGDTILIEDGLIELKVIKSSAKEILCKVIVAGTIKKNKGINVPSASISTSPLTAKDKKDLDFGLKHNIEYVALSFVRNADDIKSLRKIIKKSQKNVKIIAKIERHEAVKNLEEITKEADAIMVARGDLGTEIAAEKVPVIQREMIILAKRHAKPIIVATQMLQSMIENPIATRAEVSDAATAVFEQADALMLSNETAIGAYPVKAVETLSKVALSTEASIKDEAQLTESKINSEDIPLSNATCLNSAKLALDIQAKCIVAISMSGFTAQHISKHRLQLPIIVITEDKKIQDQLALVWGLNKIFFYNIHLKDYQKEVKNLLKKLKLVKKGDEIVIVCNASKKEKLISSILI